MDKFNATQEKLPSDKIREEIAKLDKTIREINAEIAMIPSRVWTNKQENK